MLKQISLLVLLFSELVIASDDSENDVSRNVWCALEKVLDYIYENRQNMNVDGLFGVVLAEVQLGSILKNNPNFIDARVITNLHRKTCTILQGIDLNNMELSQNNNIFAKYLLNTSIWQKQTPFSFGKLFNSTKTGSTEFRSKTCNEYRSYLEKNYFAEELSDLCLVELIKSSITMPNSCKISNACNSYLVDNHNSTPGYGVTHRLLYLQVSEARKCNWSQRWVSAKIRDYCSDILWEAQKNADCGFMTELDDLFLEQIMLCGSEGFAEFFRKSWIEQVLRIQSSQGCFGADRPRIRREANVIKFGCMDHTTGLGAAVLSLFLRFLSTDAWNLNYN